MWLAKPLECLTGLDSGDGYGRHSILENRMERGNGQKGSRCKEEMEGKRINSERRCSLKERLKFIIFSWSFMLNVKELQIFFIKLF